MKINPPPAVNMARYFFQFALGWLVLGAIGVAIVFYFKFEDIVITGFIMMFAVAALVGANFARREGRAMTWRESSMLAVLGALFCIVFRLLEFAAMLTLLSGLALRDLGAMLAKMPLQTLLVIMITGLGLGWIAIFIASGIFSRLAAKQWQKKAP